MCCGEIVCMTDREGGAGIIMVPHTTPERSATSRRLSRELLFALSTLSNSTNLFPILDEAFTFSKTCRIKRLALRSAQIQRATRKAVCDAAEKSVESRILLMDIAEPVIDACMAWTSF